MKTRGKRKRKRKRIMNKKGRARERREKERERRVGSFNNGSEIRFKNKKKISKQTMSILTYPNLT
jgi:hypothetical protein